jgi:hypothetical protein
MQSEAQVDPAAPQRAAGNEAGLNVLPACASVVSPLASPRTEARRRHPQSRTTGTRRTAGGDRVNDPRAGLVAALRHFSPRSPAAIRSSLSVPLFARIRAPMAWNSRRPPRTSCSSAAHWQAECRLPMRGTPSPCSRNREKIPPRLSNGGGGIRIQGPQTGDNGFSRPSGIPRQPARGAEPSARGMPGGMKSATRSDQPIVLVLVLAEGHPRESFPFQPLREHIEVAVDHCVSSNAGTTESAPVASQSGAKGQSDLVASRSVDGVAMTVIPGFCQRLFVRSAALANGFTAEARW